MIKLIIFDLDGVLVDARELHYQALNKSLAMFSKDYIINREEHLSSFDGLPTSKKLRMLTEKKGLPPNLYDAVWAAKQDKTLEIIKNTMVFDEHMREILRRLRSDGLQICVASNSIRESLKMMLIKKGLLEFIDFYYSNQDVKNSKPNVEMYLKCMIKAGVSPKETIIVEDSHIGRKAALNSGAYLCAVKNPGDVSYERINNQIRDLDKISSIKPKWLGGKMNILIPMAGAGSRFQEAGYTFPKPLIEVNGKPMIQAVVENLNIDGNYIFVVQEEHYIKYNLQYLLNLVAPNCKIVCVNGVTEGAACTTLLAEQYINNDEPLLLSNSDQYVMWDSNEFMYSMMGDNIDGGILTFEAIHPKWSFVRLNNEGFVCEVAEKKPISNKATVGIYYWGRGSDYVKYANQMISKNVRTNNEFYVCPVFNEAIQDGKIIKHFQIDKMYGLGTPEDLNTFLAEVK